MQYNTQTRKGQCIPVTSAARRQRQKDQELKASFGYLVSQDYLGLQQTVSKTKQNTNKLKKKPETQRDIAPVVKC